ncbi:hypothetical protein K402DRAFT_443239 [Aulographum hederae CBS 113979]|uniref:histidine kinase n=1 Tax=Aulographum hederae CBS 113979 TaxID=1176131 RepID=A0A6G1HHG6_9PEZI|nr:hypothetical protein K402DRAFT_443239 [Aulographum hederae CBS 113979]
MDPPPISFPDAIADDRSRSSGSRQSGIINMSNVSSAYTLPICIPAWVRRPKKTLSNDIEEEKGKVSEVEEDEEEKKDPEAESPAPRILSKDSIWTGPPPGESQHARVRDTAVHESSGFDWTNPGAPPRMSYFIGLARSIDWSTTPLGPMDSWPAQLKLMCNVIFNDPNPAVMFWGPDFVMVYNEGYAAMIKDHHERGAFGCSAKDAIPDFADDLLTTLSSVWDTCHPISQKNRRVFLDRDGKLEESYFSFTFLPLFDAEDEVVACYETVTENTRQYLLDRHLKALLEIGHRTSRSRSLEDYWMSVMASLALPIMHEDAPFAILYSIEGNTSTHNSLSRESYSTRSSQKSNQETQCTRRGTLGIPAGHAVAPILEDVATAEDAFMPFVREAIETRQKVLVPFDNELFDNGKAVEDFEWRGFGEPCKQAIVLPIMPTASGNVKTVLILGLNTRRPLDDDYQMFLNMLNGLLTTSLASVTLLEDEMRRGRAAQARATIVQDRLGDDLLVSQKQTELSQKRFERFADRADVAFFALTEDGKYTYQNERWYDIFRTCDDCNTIFESWNKVVSPSDVGWAESRWQELLQEKKTVSFEIKLTLPFIPGKELHKSRADAEGHHTWVWYSVYPDIDEDGSILELVGCATDISHQKWGEQVQKHRAEDAIEQKRQLENFIDSVSHEIRNPLSAIIQSADDLVTSHSASLDFPFEDSLFRDSLTRGIDAAKVILHCAQHQKRVVDDILLVSKLDSELLAITPVEAEPEGIARTALLMIASDSRTASVDVQLQLESSYLSQNIDSVLLDSTRLSQVLVSLVSSAINSTEVDQQRRIVLSLGATSERPTRSSRGVAFKPITTAYQDLTLGPGWGTGEAVYLQFNLADSARGEHNTNTEAVVTGLSDERPRTYSFYGGSGLSLFIARRLTEIHGGTIGFDSEPGQDAVFSFYVKARKKKNHTRQARPAGASSRSPRAPRSPARQAVPLSFPGRVRGRSRSPSPLSQHAVFEPVWRPEGRSPAPSPVGRVHALVVEDNMVNQKVLTKQLLNLGFTVSTANNGLEALTQLTDDPHGTLADLATAFVVLLDWEMPVMDGLTCVQKIRERRFAGRGRLPVIGVTANARPEQIGMALRAGMDDVVSKPFRVPDLVAKIKGVLLPVGEDRRQHTPGSGGSLPSRADRNN